MDITVEALLPTTEPFTPPAVFTPTEVALRLADEGVPVKAIARATLLPSEEVYQLIQEAMNAGTLVEMPQPDWPPASRRAARAVFDGTLMSNETNLKLALSRVFKATRMESAVLALMLKRNEVTKEQLHHTIKNTRPGSTRETDVKMVDVVICHMRKKLRLFGLSVDTVWGRGYTISMADRQRAVALLSGATLDEAPLGSAALDEAVAV
jgi:DNA-binding response OmpR family regulator